MSPPLVEKVVTGGTERRGVWSGKDGSRFHSFDEVRNAEEAASDHAARWVEVNL